MAFRKEALGVEVNILTGPTHMKLMEGHHYEDSAPKREPRQKAVIKYIESIEGAQYAICIAVNKRFVSTGCEAPAFKVTVNGISPSNSFWEEGETIERMILSGPKANQEDDVELKKFQFKPVRMVDTENMNEIKRDVNRSEHIGEIVVAVFPANLGEKKAVVSDRPGAQENPAELSIKTLKTTEERGFSHGTSFTCRHVDGKDSPIATFISHYRPIGCLVENDVQPVNSDSSEPEAEEGNRVDDLFVHQDTSPAEARRRGRNEFVPDPFEDDISPVQTSFKLKKKSPLSKSSQKKAPPVITPSKTKNLVGQGHFQNGSTRKSSPAAAFRNPSMVVSHLKLHGDCPASRVLSIKLPDSVKNTAEPEVPAIQVHWHTLEGSLGKPISEATASQQRRVVPETPAIAPAVPTPVHHTPAVQAPAPGANNFINMLFQDLTDEQTLAMIRQLRAKALDQSAPAASQMMSPAQPKPMFDPTPAPTIDGTPLPTIEATPSAPAAQINSESREPVIKQEESVEERRRASAVPGLARKSGPYERQMENGHIEIDLTTPTPPPVVRSVSQPVVPPNEATDKQDKCEEPETDGALAGDESEVDIKADPAGDDIDMGEYLDARKTSLNTDTLADIHDREIDLQLHADTLAHILENESTISIKDTVFTTVKGINPMFTTDDSFAYMLDFHDIDGDMRYCTRGKSRSMSLENRIANLRQESAPCECTAVPDLSLKSPFEKHTFGRASGAKISESSDSNTQSGKCIAFEKPNSTADGGVLMGYESSDHDISMDLNQYLQQLHENGHKVERYPGPTHYNNPLRGQRLENRASDGASWTTIIDDSAEFTTSGATPDTDEVSQFVAGSMLEDGIADDVSDFMEVLQQKSIATIPDENRETSVSKTILGAEADKANAHLASLVKESQDILEGPHASLFQTVADVDNAGLVARTFTASKEEGLRQIIGSCDAVTFVEKSINEINNDVAMEDHVDGSVATLCFPIRYESSERSTNEDEADNENQVPGHDATTVANRLTLVQEEQESTAVEFVTATRVRARNAFDRGTPFAQVLKEIATTSVQTPNAETPSAQLLADLQATKNYAAVVPSILSPSDQLFLDLGFNPAEDDSVTSPIEVPRTPPRLPNIGLWSQRKVSGPGVDVEGGVVPETPTRKVKHPELPAWASDALAAGSFCTKARGLVTPATEVAGDDVDAVGYFNPSEVTTPVRIKEEGVKAIKSHDAAVTLSTPAKEMVREANKTNVNNNRDLAELSLSTPKKPSSSNLGTDDGLEKRAAETFAEAKETGKIKHVATPLESMQVFGLSTRSSSKGKEVATPSKSMAKLSLNTPGSSKRLFSTPTSSGKQLKFDTNGNPISLPAQNLFGTPGSKSSVKRERVGDEDAGVDDTPSKKMKCLGLGNKTEEPISLYDCDE